MLRSWTAILVVLGLVLIEKVDSAYTVLDQACSGGREDICSVKALGHEGTYYAFSKIHVKITRVEFDRLETGSVIDLRNLPRLQLVSIGGPVLVSCPLILLRQQYETVDVYFDNNRVNVTGCSALDGRTVSASSTEDMSDATITSIVPDEVVTSTPSTLDMSDATTSGIIVSSSSTRDMRDATIHHSTPGDTIVSSPSTRDMSDVTIHRSTPGDTIDDTRTVSTAAAKIYTISTSLSPASEITTHSSDSNPATVIDLASVMGTSITAAVCVVALIVLIICHRLKVIRLKRVRLNNIADFSMQTESSGQSFLTETTFSDVGDISQGTPSVADGDDIEMSTFPPTPAPQNPPTQIPYTLSTKVEPIYSATVTYRVVAKGLLRTVFFFVFF